jgi:hypothetical protein
MSAPGLWHLGARTGQLGGGVDGWRTLARAAATLSQRLRAATDPLAASWRGASTEAYYQHRARALGLADTVSTVAGAIAATVEAAVAALSFGQTHLDDSWLRLTRAVPGLRGFEFPVFGSPVEVLALSVAAGAAGDAVRAAIAEAHDIRDHVDGRLTGYAAELGRQRLRLEAPMQALSAYVTPWLRPDELGTPGAILIDGNRVIVNGTGGNDVIDVTTDPDTDDLLVSVDGAVSRFPPGVRLVLRGGDGNDRITLDTPTRVTGVLGGDIAVLQVHPAPDVTVLGGLGDDVIQGGDGDDSLYGLQGRDILKGGGGFDYLSGGDDNDYLDGGDGRDELAGGRSDDVLYGLDGDDRLYGGGGDDYLDGGAGADLVSGDGGDDALVGGRGDDTVLGGDGNDRLYGGEGTDRLAGGPGTDNRAYAQPDDQVTGVAQRVDVKLTSAGSFITVDGSPEFAARVQSDLDALRSSPTGQQMLIQLQDTHDHGTGQFPVSDAGSTLNIVAYDGPNGYDNWDDSRPTVHNTVQYNPAYSGSAGPPITALYHEFAHADDSFARTGAQGVYAGPDDAGVRNLEREAVGLPIDDDGRLSTPDRLDPDHPYALTENALRQELGVPLRASYKP